MEPLYKLSLREVVTGTRERRWSAAQVMRAALHRIQALEPQVRAWEHLDAEVAIARAEAVDAAREQGQAAGALHGAPIGVKDIIDVAGMPTKCGSPIYATAAPAAESAECVQALVSAGAVIVGKTVTTEFAYYAPRQTRNPWNASHTPGGSSMGSAASVACGMVAGALGTQTNGSVIRPAAFCGVVGFKPSYGTVSNHGTLDPWPTLDHTGVFARNVADAALLAATIAEGGALTATVTVLERPPRLALVRSPVWHLAEAAQKDMLAFNAKTLRAAGAQVHELGLPTDYADAHRVHRVILGYEGARHFGALQKEHRDRMSVQFNALLDEGAGIADREYREALARTAQLRKDFAQITSGYDAIITPPAPGEAPATLEQTGNPTFCTMWTLLGVPAITIPVGFGPGGLPLGLQIVGRMREDDQTVAVAAWCESRLPFSWTAVTYFTQLFNLMVEVMLPLTLLVAAGALWPRFFPRHPGRARAHASEPARDVSLLSVHSLCGGGFDAAQRQPAVGSAAGRHRVAHLRAHSLRDAVSAAAMAAAHRPDARRHHARRHVRKYVQHRRAGAHILLRPGRDALRRIQRHVDDHAARVEPRRLDCDAAGLARPAESYPAVWRVMVSMPPIWAFILGVGTQQLGLTYQPLVNATSLHRPGDDTRDAVRARNDDTLAQPRAAHRDTLRGAREAHRDADHRVGRGTPHFLADGRSAVCIGGGRRNAADAHGASARRPFSAGFFGHGAADRLEHDLVLDHVAAHHGTRVDTLESVNRES